MFDEHQAIARRIRAWADGEQPGPYALELYPTLRCNLQCRYCDTTLRHVKPDPDAELSADELDRLVDEAADLGARKLSVLGGGEPFEAPAATFATLERAKQRGLHVLLGTNATLLSVPQLQRLVAIGVDEVHVSLDGPTARVHDAQRDRSFRRVATAIAQLAAAKLQAGSDRPRIVAHCVVTRKNVGALPGLVRFAAENGVQRVNFDHLIAYTPEMEPLRVGPRQTRKLRAAVDGLRAEAARLGVEHDADNLIAEGAEQRGRIVHPLRLDEEAWAGATCYFPWFYLSIRSDGSCGPCCVAAGELPGVRGKPLAEVWHGPEFERLRERMLYRVPLDYCRHCSAALQALSADVRAVLREDGRPSGRLPRAMLEQQVRLLDAALQARSESRLEQEALLRRQGEELNALSRDLDALEQARAKAQQQLDRADAALAREKYRHRKARERHRRSEQDKLALNEQLAAARALAERCEQAERTSAALHERLSAERAAMDRERHAARDERDELKRRLRNERRKIGRLKEQLRQARDELFEVQRQRDETDFDLSARLRATQAALDNRRQRLDAINRSLSWRALRRLRLVRDE